MSWSASAWHAVVSGRQQAAAAGHTGDEAGARRMRHDSDPAVRATALAALERLGALTDADLAAGLADPDPAVRRRACQVAARHPAVDLVPLLSDEAAVAEMAAWALGEHGGAAPGAAVAALAGMAGGHADPLCREAAVAALGAIGDRAGLPAILAAASDRPAIRRRAVLALAPFDGPEVDAALERALTDRDWQVRQAAEDLTTPGAQQD
jgi:HEAT repeat protein